MQTPSEALLRSSEARRYAGVISSNEGLGPEAGAVGPVVAEQASRNIPPDDDVFTGKAPDSQVSIDPPCTAPDGLIAPPGRPALSLFKRCFDASVAAVALVVLSPIMLAIAVAIRLESPGPAIFRQSRTGLGGQVFTVLKFRSMRDGSDAGSNAPAEFNDPRITRLGRILRAGSIDELPQLLNVLKGEMSLVGPRPHAVDHDLQYMSSVDGYRSRFGARPGITGLAQVSGSRGGGDVFDMRRRAVMDAHYISEWSFVLDLRIMLLTVPHLLSFKAH